MSSSFPTIPFRVGHGYDVHTFAPGRRLVLGGVEIPADYGLLGHSDADVLSHALADALFGALALPDIGHWFPNTDARCKDMDSQDILAKAREEVCLRGYVVANVDCTLVAERPKIGPHISAMQTRLANTLQITPAQVGIKATTHEKMGALGRGEGISATAVALLMLKA